MNKTSVKNIYWIIACAGNVKGFNLKSVLLATVGAGAAYSLQVALYASNVTSTLFGGVGPEN